MWAEASHPTSSTQTSVLLSPEPVLSCLAPGPSEGTWNTCSAGLQASLDKTTCTCRLFSRFSQGRLRRNSFFLPNTTAVKGNIKSVWLLCDGWVLRSAVTGPQSAEMWEKTAPCEMKIVVFFSSVQWKLTSPQLSQLCWTCFLAHCYVPKPPAVLAPCVWRTSLNLCWGLRKTESGIKVSSSIQIKSWLKMDRIKWQNI